MQGLMSVWTTLGNTKRLMVIGATIAMFLAVLTVARMAGSSDMTLLFGGLEPNAAGEVITSLDQRGVRYEVRGGAIYVPMEDRDQLRMALAGEGLPQTGLKGYELLDGLSGFGTTSQMFDAAYWRAREGELARTIQSSPAIRTARVHLSTPGTQRFQRDIAATASVTVTTVQATLSRSQIEALQYLVASAVTGLNPSDVAIIDDVSGLLTGSPDAPASALADTRADMLRNRAERLLAARVGPGNAVVEVTVDTVTQAEQITERTVDPASRIAISTDVTENSSTAQDAAGGGVTVASNVPDGDAGGGTSSNQDNESRVLTNYEISQTERQIVRSPGAVRRLTVAVLVNDRIETAPDGTTSLTPRAPEELEDLTKLVSSAVGLDEDRGDIITLRSMPFGPQPALGTDAPATTLLQGPLSLMQIVQMAVAALVALILGLFVVRPVLTNAKIADALPPPGAGDVTAQESGAVIDGKATAMIGSDAEISDAAPTDAVARLRKMIAERETETVQVLQDWMEQPERGVS